jgi:uncharacterized membrane protein
MLDLFFSTTTIEWIHSLAAIVFISLYSAMILIVKNVDRRMPFPYPFLDLVNASSDSINYLNLLGFNAITALVLLGFVFLTMFLVATRDKYLKPRPRIQDLDQIKV